MKLRNTYHVPAGQVVTVPTPQGPIDYRGGQFVPPEQLAKARIKTTGKGQGQGTEGSAKGAEAPPWGELFEQYKTINIFDRKQVNKAIYLIDDYTVVDIKSTERTPGVARLAADLSIANIMQSIPGVQKLFQGNITINILPKSDSLRKVGGNSFSQVGEVSFEDNSMTVYSHGNTLTDLFKNVVDFTSYKFGLVLIDNIVVALENQEKSIPILQKQVDEGTKQLEGAKKDKETEGLAMQLDAFQQEIDKYGILKKLVGDLKAVSIKEKGLNKHIEEHISEKDPLGYYEQFAKTLAYANIYSFTHQQTFFSGLERLAETVPETVKVVKKILQVLGQGEENG